MRALGRWLGAAEITDGLVFRRTWLPEPPNPGEPPALPRLGTALLTTQAIADIVKARVDVALFNRKRFGEHSLKRGPITTGMADLKRMGRHKSFDILGEYLEFGDPCERHPLSAVLCPDPIRGSLGRFSRGIKGVLSVAGPSPEDHPSEYR